MITRNSIFDTKSALRLLLAGLLLGSVTLIGACSRTETTRTTTEQTTTRQNVTTAPASTTVTTTKTQEYTP